MSTVAQFQFFMFGTPRLVVNDEVVSLPPQPAAFCSFLILNRQRRITREEVQTAFWPDAAPERAQERLRRTLYLLRRSLGPHTTLIATEGVEVAVSPETSLWVDYETFESALLDAFRDEQPRRVPLQRAVELYRDDLLKDIYADWVLLEREHARQQFLTALRHLLTVCQQEHDWPGVTRYAHNLLEYDPFQEVAHRALMRAFAASGDRSAALRQYQQCAAIMLEELDAEPLEETTRLYEDIRQGRGVVPEMPVVVAPPPTPVPAITDLQSVPLVGRDAELEAVAAEWQVCQRGQSRLVLVIGPAGMGKTRLVNEAAQRIPGPGVVTITGHCYAMEAGTPYQLIADLMQRAVDRVLEQLSPTVRDDLAAIVPSLQSPHALEMGSAPDASLRVQEAVTHVMRALARTGTGLWVLAEDLHWADPVSLAVLNYALRRCVDLPLFVLGTLRDEEVSFDSPLMDWPTASVHAPAPTTVIELPPLPQEQLAQMVEQLVGTDSQSLTALLHHETAGNPFFVVETLRALVEQEVLYADQASGTDGWRLRADALPQPANLPMSDVVLRVIRGRIRRLSRAAQDVLTVAAVIEHNIDEKLLAALVDSPALDLALDELLQALILEETSPGIYQFLHIKVREIVYADTSAPRRRFLHRRAAEALAHAPGHTQLATVAKLAYHYAQAREWTPALVHGWQAAQTAFAAGALAEANRYAEVAQEILDAYGTDIIENDLPASLVAIKFDLLVLRAEFQRQAMTAGMTYPPDLMDAIVELLPEVDESRRARALLQQAFHLLGQGDLSGAKGAAERGRALYVALDHQRGILDAMQHQFDIAYRAGDMVAVRRLVGDLRDLSATVTHDDVRQMRLYNEMRLAVYQAEWGTLLRLAQELSSEQDYADPAIAWQSLADLGLAYLKLGAHDEAAEVAQRAVQASEQAGVLGLGARVLLGKLELRRGDLQHAHEILLDLVETPDPLVGEGELVSPTLALVRCCIAAGEIASAKKWAKRAARAVMHVQLPLLFPLAEIAWMLARLAEEQYADVQRRLRYPLEYMLLLEDTSPQEIFALRAAAARGLGDDDQVQQWLIQAGDALHTQADAIAAEPCSAPYCESFLTRVPLHNFIHHALDGADWQPGDVLVY